MWSWTIGRIWDTNLLAFIAISNLGVNGAEGARKKSVSRASCGCVLELTSSKVWKRVNARRCKCFNVICCFLTQFVNNIAPLTLMMCNVRTSERTMIMSCFWRRLDGVVKLQRGSSFFPLSSSHLTTWHRDWVVVFPTGKKRQNAPERSGNNTFIHHHIHQCLYLHVLLHNTFWTWTILLLRLKTSSPFFISHHFCLPIIII